MAVPLKISTARLQVIVFYCISSNASRGYYIFACDGAMELQVQFKGGDYSTRTMFTWHIQLLVHIAHITYTYMYIHCKMCKLWGCYESGGIMSQFQNPPISDLASTHLVCS